MFSKKFNPFSKRLLASFCPISIELGTEKYFFSSQFIFTPTESESIIDVTVGYGRNLYFNHFGKFSTDGNKGKYVFKPSLSISYKQYGGGLFSRNSPVIGEIDNAGKTIDIYGQYASPSFDVSTTDDDNNTTTIRYTAQDLFVTYVHREWSAVPKIAIASNQNKHIFYWELDLGYAIAFSETDGIELDQSSAGDDGRNRVGKFSNLYKKNAPVTYNNAVITKSPYNFSGLFVGFTVGAAILKKHAYKF